MEKYTGKSIFKGIAIGKILFYQKGEQPVKRVKIEDTAEQIKRYEDARAKAAEQLQGLYEKALKEVGEANAAVFEVHQMMLEDDDYIDSVNIIETQQVNAEFAVATTGDNFAKMFAEMEDDYFKARAADVKDISERMVNILSGNESGGALGDEPVIVVAEDLAPSETVQMDKENQTWICKLTYCNPCKNHEHSGIDRSRYQRRMEWKDGSRRRLHRNILH